MESIFSELEECRADETDVQWLEEDGADPAGLLVRVVTEQLAPPGARPYVIFLDESDTIDALPPTGREALASAFAELMTTSPGGEKYPITLCLLGSLPPVSLGEWNEQLPGLLEKERLDDFTKKQIQKAAEDIIKPHFTECEPDDVVNECFRRTQGHPFLTQLLLHQAVGIGDKDLDRLSEELDDFVREELPSRFHSKLRDAEERMLSSKGLGAVHPKDRLALYKNLLEGNIPTSTEDDRQITLYLSGLTAFRDFGKGPQLRRRNSIFSGYFDKKWLENTDKKINPPPLPNTHEVDAKIVELVESVFCKMPDGSPGPYELIKKSGRELFKDQFYEFRLTDPKTRRPFTLQLFKGLQETGGDLWRRVARTLIRVSGYRHETLPEIEDGGTRKIKDKDGMDGKPEEFAYVIIRAGGATLADSSHVIEALQNDKRRALVQFARLAEALVKLHENRLVHRNLHPGAIDVLEKFDAEDAPEDWILRLIRFEMSDLVDDLLWDLYEKHKEDPSRQKFSVEEARQLYAGKTEDLVYLAPERLALLFESEGEEMLEGLYSDVFSLGMVVYQWFVGDLPKDRVDAVFAGEDYNPDAHKELVGSMIDEIKAVSSRKVPEKLQTLLTKMLDFDSPRTRPTAFQVVSDIAGSLDAIEEDWNEGGAERRFMLAYMADPMVDYFQHRGWIHGDRKVAEEDLPELLRNDLHTAVLTYSRRGSAPFENLPKERHAQARFVLRGQNFTHFCHPWRGQGGHGEEDPRVLLIRFSHPKEKTERLKNNRVQRSVTGIEIFPVHRGQLPKEVDEFPPWTETLGTVEQLSILGQRRSGASSGIWRHDVEDALDFLLQLHRCRAETHLYPVKVDPIGSNRYALRYKEIRHREYLQGNPLRNQLAGRSPPSMRDFFSEAAAQTGRLMLLSDNKGQPGSEWGVEVKLIDEKTAGDRIVIERLHKTDVIPASAWLQPTEDAGVFWQLKQQQDACHELMGMQALVAQLGDPVSVAGLRNQWGEVDKDIQGGARKIIHNMLDSWPLFALQGPPGTGKTTVAAEAIGLMLAEEPHQRILISAQSHYALDNLAERVMKTLKKHASSKKSVGEIIVF
uniref:Protein kinase domain-containing protein n=1 Tax=Candidatus Kentrum sp. LFY TaxID=2126342 RepID=A0A450X3S7_9GAMM|nr:MAG: Protein kinase domain-containing protein [Candidatus Kentron sp. LFY]